jgi:hypothetical protein
VDLSCHRLPGGGAARRQALLSRPWPKSPEERPQPGELRRAWQVHVVRHGLKPDQLGLTLLRETAQECLQALCSLLVQDRATVLGAPDDMVLAGADDVATGSVRSSSCHSCGVSSPMPEGRGIRCRLGLVAHPPLCPQSRLTEPPPVGTPEFEHAEAPVQEKRLQISGVTGALDDPAAAAHRPAGRKDCEALLTPPIPLTDELEKLLLGPRRRPEPLDLIQGEHLRVQKAPPGA